MNNSKSSDELYYSSEALATRPLFYQELNDVNLFVEDVGLEYVYETIFKRLLKDKYRITAIFALGGKTNVKHKYTEVGSSINGVKNFYIVDGDFDRYIAPNKMINDECFIYLKTYNIENYFVDQYACEQFAKSKIKCLDREVTVRVGFADWKKRIVNEAKKLFLYYCLIQKFNLGIQTLSRSEYQFIDQKNGFERTDDSFEEFKNSVLNLFPDAEDKIIEIASAYEKINGDDYSNFICGKFLLKSLYCHLRNIANKKFSTDDFKWYLVNNFDISKLNYIKETITKL